MAEMGGHIHTHAAPLCQLQWLLLPFTASEGRRSGEYLVAVKEALQACFLVEAVVCP